jgi:hypothetical protein
MDAGVKNKLNEGVEDRKNISCTRGKALEEVAWMGGH